MTDTAFSVVNKSDVVGRQWALWNLSLRHQCSPNFFGSTAVAMAVAFDSISDRLVLGQDGWASTSRHEGVAFCGYGTTVNAISSSQLTPHSPTESHGLLMT